MNEAKAIREELSYIGRYLTGISPKLAKYKELEERRDFLRKELKKHPDRESGTNPEPLPKKYKAGKKFIVPTASPDYTLETQHRKIDRLAHRTNIKL
jgi:hypothetical protein